MNISVSSVAFMVSQIIHPGACAGRYCNLFVGAPPLAELLQDVFQSSSLGLSSSVCVLQLCHVHLVLSAGTLGDYKSYIRSLGDEWCVFIVLVRMESYKYSCSRVRWSGICLRLVVAVVLGCITCRTNMVYSSV